MTSFAHPMHHQHKRKRVYVKNEKYPSENKLYRIMDKAIYVIAVIGPLFVSSQAIKIWKLHDASSVSFVTWLTFLIASIFWFIYGLMHKEKAIVFANFLWIVVQLMVVIGIVKYG